MPTDRQEPCPLCGRRRPGRPKADVPVQNVLRRLSEGGTVAVVATELGISRAAVYRVKATLPISNGSTPGGKA